MQICRSRVAYVVALAAWLLTGRTELGALEKLSLSDISKSLEAWGPMRAQLAARKEDQKLWKSLDRALTLGSDCRWEAGAKQVRMLLDKHADVARRNARFFASTIFALEYAVTLSREDIQKIFSTSDGKFEPASGILTLTYHDAVPKAWELQGTREQGSGTLVLSGGKTISVDVPFRRPGGLRYYGSRKTVTEPCLGQARTVSLKEQSTAEFSWATHDEPGKKVKALYRLERLDSGEGRAGAELRINAIEQSTRKTVSVGKAVFATRRTISAEVTERAVVFSLDESYKQSMKIPRTDCLRFEMRGEGTAVELDWIKVSGAVEGLWLSRQLVLHSTERAEKFLANWGNPLE